MTRNNKPDQDQDTSTAASVLAGDLVGDEDLITSEDGAGHAADPDPYEVLQRQFEEANAERDAAKRRAAEEQNRRAELEGHVGRLQSERAVSDRVVCEHAINAVNGEAEDAQRNYAIALSNGDYSTAAQAQRLIAAAEVKLNKLYEVYEVVKNKAYAPPPPPQPVTSDPVEHIISTGFPNPRDQKWLRDHRDDVFGSEDRKELAIAGHKTATVKYGIAPGTDEYYDFLDEHMGYSTSSQPTKQASRKNFTPSAPVSRGAGSSGSGDYVSPKEAALARDMGMTVSRYREMQAEARKPGARASFITRA
jgi:hypothetical protein